MGPVAEPYVIPYVDNNDLFVRQDAREILSAIGGKKSLKVLQAQLAKADFSEKNQLQTAVAAIEARTNPNRKEQRIPVWPPARPRQLRQWPPKRMRLDQNLVPGATRRVPTKLRLLSFALPMAKLP